MDLLTELKLPHSRMHAHTHTHTYTYNEMTILQVVNLRTGMEDCFSTPVQTGFGAHPACCTMDTRSFPGVKSSRGVTLTPHLLLVPWSRKGRTIPLVPLSAVRPVQRLSACTRVHFTFLWTTIIISNGALSLF